MNANIISQYQIDFINQIYHNPISNLNYISKIPNIDNEYLFQFLYDWSAEGITDDLLPAINQVINGLINEYETGSETTTLNIFQNKVDFYDNDLNYVGNIPTQDFNEICIGWRDFLLTPPLNGTQVP